MTTCLGRGCPFPIHQNVLIIKINKTARNFNQFSIICALFGLLTSE
ncbi:hypothetical protein SAMN02745824_1582 [Parasphingorhabdus marina DSM 22363]|uniref:Uncharacterized protein n=1 Tax=Parasphingorhabdus marina DSM 22363 TaxID=1123272 RepID=A0A1N6D5P4_9SPHN|nr:hypothetical protein SAMN02745824_1582 [Parasphingorhabdus marina DSM 22363]